MCLKNEETIFSHDRSYQVRRVRARRKHHREKSARQTRNLTLSVIYIGIFVKLHLITKSRVSLWTTGGCGSMLFGDASDVLSLHDWFLSFFIVAAGTRTLIGLGCISFGEYSVNEHLLAFYFRARSTVPARVLKIVIRALRRDRFKNSFTRPRRKESGVALRDLYFDLKFVIVLQSIETIGFPSIFSS